LLELVHTSPWAWTTLCLLLGLIAGGLQASGWRTRLSNDLLGEQQRLRLLETKSEHQRFGISDLKLRIRLSHRESALLRTDLKLLRSTYAQLDAELQAQWDAEINDKSALMSQQADKERLQSELADWKARLSKLQEQLDEGAIDESQLKKELTLGITAVCEHNSTEMTAVQELLRDCASQIDEQTIAREPQKVIGLLAAKVELLEGQIIYWQDLAINNQQVELAQASETPLEFSSADQASIGSIKLSDSAPTDNPAANTDEATLSDARNRIAEKSKQAHDPKQSKRKRRNRNKTMRGKKAPKNGTSADDLDDGTDDATELSQQA
jgi:hypothetical protein